jgi:hypothetical protein
MYKMNEDVLLVCARGATAGDVSFIRRYANDVPLAPNS